MEQSIAWEFVVSLSVAEKIRSFRGHKLIFVISMHIFVLLGRYQYGTNA